MNDYEIDTFSQWREHPRQTETRRVTAHSAADALTIVEFELGRGSPRREWVSAIRCVERVASAAKPSAAAIRGAGTFAGIAKRVWIEGDQVAYEAIPLLEARLTCIAIQPTPFVELAEVRVGTLFLQLGNLKIPLGAGLSWEFRCPSRQLITNPAVGVRIYLRAKRRGLPPPAGPIVWFDPVERDSRGAPRDYSALGGSLWP